MSIDIIIDYSQLVRKLVLDISPLFDRIIRLQSPDIQRYSVKRTECVRSDINVGDCLFVVKILPFGLRWRQIKQDP